MTHFSTFARQTALGFALACGLAASASAAPFAFTGTRSNVNALLPPGSGRCAPTYFNTVSISPSNGSSTGTSNLGDFTSTQSHCIVTAPPTDIVDGFFTYDFGLGDTLFGTYTGNVALSGTPGRFNATENLSVTGGTGRFLGALGSITTSGALFFASGNGNYSGTIRGTLDLAEAPEPASLALMTSGLGLAAGMRRRARGLSPS